MSWKKGPLPANTWGWGGVTILGEDGAGFYFADFTGVGAKLPDGRIITADKVALYDNSLELPPEPHKKEARLDAIAPKTA